MIQDTREEWDHEKNQPMSQSLAELREKQQALKVFQVSPADYDAQTRERLAQNDLIVKEGLEGLRRMKAAATAVKLASLLPCDDTDEPIAKREVVRGVHVRKPGEVIVDTNSGGIVHSPEERAVSNEERLDLFLKASREHRNDLPRDQWRAANLAAEAVDTLRDDVLKLTNSLYAAHMEQIKWMGDPTGYELWTEMEVLMSSIDPRLLEAIRQNKTAADRMKALLRPEPVVLAKARQLQETGSIEVETLISVERINEWNSLIDERYPGVGHNLRDSRGGVRGAEQHRHTANVAGVAVDRREICGGCGKEIDPDSCGCGDSIYHSPWQGHSPIPMGCDCGFDRGLEDEQ